MRVDADVLVPTVPDHETIVAALELATRAPSVHNTQPWLWRFDGDRLVLTADADRLLPTTDPLGRQLVISCGAALDHARTAFAEFGWHTDIARVPDPRRADRLAVLEFRPWPDPPAALRRRAHAISRRHTDRLPLREPEGWDDVLGGLRALAAARRVGIDVLDDSVRPRLAAASRRLGELRHRDVLYETELNWWTGHYGTRDGVPRAALASEAEFARVGVGRQFPAAPRSARRAGLVDRSRLLVLSTKGTTVRQWLRVGETLSTMLLHCTAAGLATCALTDVTELPAGRELLADLISHHGTPQIVIRVGTAPADAEAIAVTPRRPLSEVLTLS
ncbi:Acg family FMN-binding oxidoreductase [Nocardia otitidiscaviarum]|uniref:Acg family FMN-binding oxidoreductase n=1 Tax=Nocardia otitidiscaviarum TaxID=1823 RepID=UPI002458DBC5|nr:hypothetical protein [Nocardia otitidiscaviarum]